MTYRLNDIEMPQNTVKTWLIGKILKMNELTTNGQSRLLGLAVEIL